MAKRIDNTSCHCLKMRRSAENIINFYDSIISESGLTTRQYRIVKNVFAYSGCSMRKLSEEMQLEKSTLSRSIKPLINGGYIEDKKEKGARDSALFLTEKGKEVYEKARALWMITQERVEKKMGREKLELLERLLLEYQDL